MNRKKQKPEGNGVFKVGVISDTHGHLDPQIKDIFAGVEHIFHAGDIGMPYLLLELEEVAPVTAVLGNTDEGLDFRLTELLELNGRKFFLHHIVDPAEPDERIRGRIIRENPDVVIFGHTHKPFCENIGNTLYFNPGYAGKKRFDMPRSVAILNCDPQGITAEFINLD
ncbi:MAG: metallophosphoesterase family protein [Verrucomicrobiota bacterium]|nr:metallophosphoesterase family protein [Verrucomicrobiota bacterium]